MKTILISIVALLTVGFLAGCSGKTPEQEEADKYPKAKPLTKEQQQALDSRMANQNPPPPGSQGTGKK